MHIARFGRRWRSRKMLFDLHPPVEVSSWLFDTSSLTRRLRSRYDSFHVEVIGQSVRRPGLDEASVLGVSVDRSALIREVLLVCDGNPVVYARSIVPMATMSGSQRCYGNMGNRPLGAMLFADRSMERGEVEVSQLNPDVLDRFDIDTSETVWGRRSLFTVGGKQLLVSEFFLPALFGR